MTRDSSLFAILLVNQPICNKGYTAQGHPLTLPDLCRFGVCPRGTITGNRFLLQNQWITIPKSISQSDFPLANPAQTQVLVALIKSTTSESSLHGLPLFPALLWRGNPQQTQVIASTTISPVNSPGAP
jgi:hypothetical protein